jgi:hypothetical protein
MAIIGCGISHKDTKHTNKCSNNKTKTTQKQNDETEDKYLRHIQQTVAKNCTYYD